MQHGRARVRRSVSGSAIRHAAAHRHTHLRACWSMKSLRWARMDWRSSGSATQPLGGSLTGVSILLITAAYVVGLAGVPGADAGVAGAGADAAAWAVSAACAMQQHSSRDPGG